MRVGSNPFVRVFGSDGIISRAATTVQSPGLRTKTGAFKSNKSFQGCAFPLAKDGLFFYLEDLMCEVCGKSKEVHKVPTACVYLGLGGSTLVIMLVCKDCYSDDRQK